MNNQISGVEALEKLKNIIDTSILGNINNYISIIKDDKSLVKKLIEYRAKTTLSELNTDKEINDEQLITDINIFKILQDEDFDFNNLKINLNYSPYIPEKNVDFSTLLTIYEEEISKVHKGKYIINTDNIHDYSPIDELEDMIFRNQLMTDVVEIMEEESVDNKPKTI